MAEGTAEGGPSRRHHGHFAQRRHRHEVCLVPARHLPHGKPGQRAGANGRRDAASGDADEGVLPGRLCGDAGPVAGGHGRTIPATSRATNCPWRQVSWDDCQEFCKKLGQRTASGIACRPRRNGSTPAGRGRRRRFHFGETIQHRPGQLRRQLHLRRRQEGPVPAEDHARGQFPANAWGLYDMHGNVWEWCQDWFGDCQKEDQQDPVGSISGTARVLRGGSWSFGPGLCRSACRFLCVPVYRLGLFGCRVVLCLD